MLKIRHLFIFWVFSIIKLVELKISDKEYAHLPVIFKWDDFDRCMLLEDEALYCSIEYHLQPNDPENPSKTWNQISELSADKKNFRHDFLRHSICVPFTCPNVTVKPDAEEFREEITECYDGKYQKYGLHGIIKKIQCQTNKPLRPFDRYDKIAMIFFTSYIFLVLFATFYEGLARYKSPEEYQKLTKTNSCGKFLSCFSICKNWDRLSTVEETPDTKAFKGIQGIRFYNISLVILCHSCMLAGVGPVMNTKWAEGVLDKFLTSILASGPFAVETFFIFSSWFLSYNIFKEFNENSKKELNMKIILQILLFRFIRICPPLAVVLFFNSTLLYHLERGPNWETLVGRERDFCRENGWLNLLFLNNQINVDRMCFIETWYLATDMHCFILSIFILYFSVKKPKRLLWIIPLIYTIWQVIILGRVYLWNITHLPKSYPEDMYMHSNLYDKNGTWSWFTSGTIWNVVGALIGVVGGYTYYKYKNVQFFTKTIHQVIWWFLTLVCGFGIVIIPGLWLYSKNFYPNPWFTYPYFGLSTTIYGISIATLIIGLTQGQGWMAKWVCEWKPICILGRLSYAVFLAHYPYMLLRWSALKSLPYVDDLSIALTFFEQITISHIFGLMIHLLFELPTSALQKTYLMKENKQEDEKCMENKRKKK